MRESSSDVGERRVLIRMMKTLNLFASNEYDEHVAVTLLYHSNQSSNEDARLKDASVG